jgi:hypothetical protein
MDFLLQEARLGEPFIASLTRRGGASGAGAVWVAVRGLHSFIPHVREANDEINSEVRQANHPVMLRMPPLLEKEGRN